MLPLQRSRGGAAESSEQQNEKLIVWLKIAEFVATVGLTAFVGWKLSAALSNIMDYDNSAAKKKDMDLSRKFLASRLNRPELESMFLDAYEARIASEVLASDQLGVSFNDIGGLGDQLQEVKDNIILPMHCWRQFGMQGANMMTCPAGVLLYGKPGTGKTMTAKAISAESGASFINVKSADLMDKWMGESDKLVRAVFSLARKLAPSIIFIDEIDTLLRRRESDQTGASSSMQGTLLTEWDGIKSDNTLGENAPVIVLGATNRPMDLDGAILRRMPVQVQTMMPNLEGRVDILHKVLEHAGIYTTTAAAATAKNSIDAEEKKDMKSVEDVQASMSSVSANSTLGNDVDIQDLALRTEGYSGSDLREVVRVAILQRTKRMLNIAKIKHDEIRLTEQVLHAKALKTWESLGGSKVGPPPVMNISIGLDGIDIPEGLTVDAIDFEVALAKALPAGTAAHDYNMALNLERLLGKNQ